MRRFSSIDFLRGTAIVLMLFLHSFMLVLDYGIIDNINNLPLITMVTLLLFPYMGAMAGFFLLVSSIGNMISMQRHLQKGKSVKSLAIRQIMGGIILLIFAVLTEAWIGYHGAFGEAIRLNENALEIGFYRGYHMETIHTIAWCIIINGIVQAYLSREEKWKNTNKIIKKYVILIVIIVAMTLPVWLLVNQLVPGYPYASYSELGRGASDRIIQYPVWGETTFFEYISLFPLAAIAGHPEPIFPYLAISFLGSIIGILMSQKRKQVPLDFPKKGMQIGFIMFLIGLVGLIITLLDVMMRVGFGAMLDTYLRLWDHRGFTPNGPANTHLFGWLFQFLCVNGAALWVTLFIIYLVEFRGKGKKFGEKTKTVRRYGFVAFTVYNNQWIIYIAHFLVTLMFGLPIYTHMGFAGVFIVMAISFAMFQIMLILWEKVDYVGTLEWMMGTIGMHLIPARKEAAKEGPEELEEEACEVTRWWKEGCPNVDEAFYNAEWLNIVEESEINHKNKSESRLAFKISIIGILIFPFAILAYNIAKNSFETEEENKYNKRARLLSIIGIIIAIFWVTLSIIFTPNMLGIAI